MPIPITTTTSIGSSRCRTWTPGSARSRRSRRTSEEVVVKTGFGAILRKQFDCPMPEFIGLGDRHAGEARGGRVRRSARPAAVLRGGRQPDRRRGRRFRAEFARLGRDGQVALARLPRLRQHGRVLRVHDAAHRPAEPHDVDGHGAGPVRGGAQSRRASSTWIAPRRPSTRPGPGWTDS